MLTAAAPIVLPKTADGVQGFIMIAGLGIGAALWEFTGTLPRIAAGVGLGSGLGLLPGRRRARIRGPAPPPGTPWQSHCAADSHRGC
ncbi:hypothetical protein AVL61_11975 [Kocuria rosea subsp. polaris]|uniref:Uncharacterized protein n=1 Tax=Kocuria rosea subsp. polaris TaxID=136273 RepID=A0A0W8I4H4_KOCRO|nr:hypothetical protein AVL61_11975 [Kocuria polaris]